MGMIRNACIMFLYLAEESINWYRSLFMNISARGNLQILGEPLAKKNEEPTDRF